MKKLSFSVALGVLLLSCGGNESSTGGSYVSAIESGGENDKAYMEENKAGMDAAEEELKEDEATMTSMKIDKMTHDFGKIKLESENLCEFKITNTGKNPLNISDVKASCGCTTPQKPEGMIAPGKSDVIKVQFKPNSASVNNEPVEKTVTITANTEPRMTVVKIKAIVLEK